MKPGADLTIRYEIFLPHKNKFITTGDAIFCEHVGRNEPERLLPPILEVKTGEPIRAADFQTLVDTIHYDSEEGVNYRVLREYESKALVQVDRNLYNPYYATPPVTFTTIHLGDALNMPIMAGKSNPGYAPLSSTDKFDRRAESSSSESSANLGKTSEATPRVIKKRRAEPLRAEE